MAAGPQTNDQSQFVGSFTDVWGSDILSLFKFAAPITSRVGFESSNLVGGKFHQPVDLQLEHGFTAAASSSTPTLINATAGYVGDAQITGSQLYGRAEVSYEAMMRSAQEGKQAVKNVTKHVVKRLGLSASKRLEIMALHGQRGIGTVTSFTESGAGPWSSIMLMTDASWAAGIWAGMENANVDIYDATLSTIRNTNENVSGTGVVVTKVDVPNKSITITYTNAAKASWTSAPLATDVVFFRTHSAATEFAGLDKIGRNTASLFNIDPAVSALWAGNLYSATTGVLSMGKLLDAASIAASFGLMGANALAVISPKAFEVLNTDQAALRQYDVSYRPAKGESAFEGLTFHSQVGTIEVLPHPFQKDGLGMFIVPDELHRIGASDLTFIDRGGPQPRLILESSTKPTSEMRIQSHQAIYAEMPRHMVVMDGITY